jgi:hypothetical protein
MATRVRVKSMVVHVIVACILYMYAIYTYVTCLGMLCEMFMTCVFIECACVHVRAM